LLGCHKLVEFIHQNNAWGVKSSLQQAHMRNVPSMVSRASTALGAGEVIC
jgi:hypothetical protein